MTREEFRPVDERSGGDRPGTLDGGSSAEGELGERNGRLREKYEQATKQANRDRSSWVLDITLVTSGVVLVVISFVIPGQQPLVTASGGTIAFIGLLSIVLTADRPAEIDEQPVVTLKENQRSLVVEHGRSSKQVYLPTEGDPPARLFVPDHPRFDLPPSDALTTLSVQAVPERSRGLSLYPTGTAFFKQFEQMGYDTDGSDARHLANCLCESLVETFELATSARPVERQVDGGLTVSFQGTQFGTADQFDHPARSFIAIGLAVGLGRSITVETAESVGTTGEEVHYIWEET